MYIGDHVYAVCFLKLYCYYCSYLLPQDLQMPFRRGGWRTGAIIRELESEISTQAQQNYYQMAFLVWRKIKWDLFRFYYREKYARRCCDYCTQKAIHFQKNCRILRNVSLSADRQARLDDVWCLSLWVEVDFFQKLNSSIAFSHHKYWGWLFEHKIFIESCINKGI